MFYEKCHGNMPSQKLILVQVKTDKQLNFKILNHEKTINHSRIITLTCYPIGK